ncbi:MAG: ABC-F family ATP-binding cassette domain-containing protein [Firmicutes bacterium]|nr:ABC-F family ATP-binding cassette domain-containing protein [Bacillota bacterium]
MSIVSIESLVHSYGDRPIVCDVSVNLLAREHVCLIGRNGAGKSTLLRILAGALVPDKGAVTWTPGIRFSYLTQDAALEDAPTVRAAMRQAFAPVYAKEAEWQQTAEKLQHADDSDMDRLLARYARLQEELEESGIYELDARIDTVASGLGLLEFGLERPLTELSGGQRTRALLGRILLEQPDVLLLDEPTNFLDAEHVQWLCEYLRTYPSAFVLVTHDSDVVRAVANCIWQLEDGQLTRYNGSYDDFVVWDEVRRTGQAKAYVRQQQEIRRLEEFVQKNIARASTTKRAQSRRKQLDKIERIPPPGEGPRVSFQFPAAAPPTRIVIQAAALKVGYRHALLPALDLEVERGSKIALTGCNGIGKTTLLRTLIGALPPVAGAVLLGDRVQVGYFAQEEYAKGTRTAMQVISDAFVGLTHKEVRTALARCGLRAEKALQPVHSLSGGEQAKVRLCLLTLSPANLLVLDEPTNHLDAAAKSALQQVLCEYLGSILVVSHEPEFYQPFATDVIDVESLAASDRAQAIVARVKSHR